MKCRVDAGRTLICINYERLRKDEEGIERGICLRVLLFYDRYHITPVDHVRCWASAPARYDTGTP